MSLCTIVQCVQSDASFILSLLNKNYMLILIYFMHKSHPVFFDAVLLDEEALLEYLAYKFSTVILCSSWCMENILCEINFHFIDKLLWWSHKYRWTKKMAQCFYMPITLSNIHRFSEFFYCRNHETICSNNITKDPTTPHTCRYTTL